MPLIQETTFMCNIGAVLKWLMTMTREMSNKCKSFPTARDNPTLDWRVGGFGSDHNAATSGFSQAQWTLKKLGLTLQWGSTNGSFPCQQLASATAGPPDAASTSRCTRRPGGAASAWAARATGTGSTASDACPITSSPSPRTTGAEPPARLATVIPLVSTSSLFKD